MVNLLTLRTEVTANLTAAGFTVAGWCDRKTPPYPCVIVAPGDPYVELADESVHGGRWLATLTVTLITGRGPDEQTAAELDTMIAGALLALTPSAATTTIPGDYGGFPPRVEVRDAAVDTERVVGAILSISYPINMKES